MFGPSTHEEDGQGVAETDTLQVLLGHPDNTSALGNGGGGSDDGAGHDGSDVVSGDVIGDGAASASGGDDRGAGDKGNNSGGSNLGGGNVPVESTRRRAKQYTVPHNSRPGQRCASAKAELGDDLLTVVAVVPIGPFDFETRGYLREFLSKPARKLRSREYYRKIKTLNKPKREQLFEWYRNHVRWLNKSFQGIKNRNYSSYKWGWNLKVVGDPAPDPRAVCIDVMFMVGDQRCLHSHHHRVSCCVGKPHLKLSLN